MAHAERFAVAYVKNRVVSIPLSRVLVEARLKAKVTTAFGGVLAGSRCQLWYTDAFFEADPPFDLAVIGAATQAPGDCREVLLLPDAVDGTHHHAVRLSLGPARAPIVMLPGFTGSDGNSLNHTALARLDAGRNLAAELGAAAVILSGWGGWSADSLRDTEAVQLSCITDGWPVPVLLDTAARTTAENIICLREFVAALGNVSSAHAVASWTNAPRMELLGRLAWRDVDGVPLRMHVCWGGPHSTALRAGVAGLWFMHRHIRAGEALLTHGPFDARAKP